MLNKLLVFLTFMILCTNIGISQDIEHYKNISENSTGANARLAAMDSVISKSFRVDDDVFVEFSLKYIDLAKEIDSIEWAAKKAINLHYTLSSVKNQPKKALSVIDGILLHKYKISDSYLLGALYLKRGGANFKLDLNQAVKDYEKAIENFGEKDSLYIADTYLFSGQAYSNLGKFVPAGENYRKAYDYFEALKDYEYMFYAQQGNVIMFSMNGFFDKAKKERDILIKKALELDIKNFVVLEHYNQSLDYRKMGKSELQIQSLLKAESYLDYTSRTKNDHTTIYSALVEYYSHHQNLDKAKIAIDSLESWRESMKDNLLMESNYLSAKAEYAFANELYKEALEFTRSGLKNLEILGYEEEIMDKHLFLSRIYTKLGDYKKGIESQNAYMAIKDSLYNNITANSLAYYQTLYETEKKEKDLVEKTSSIQLLEKDSESFKKLVFFIATALLLVFGLVLLYRNQLHLKDNKLLQEKFSQELLVSQENERKRVSKDLHDGIGQRLLLIKNKLLANGDDDTKWMVDNAIDEVRAISRALHPFQLQEMGITRAIEHTLTQIDENTTLFISSEIDNIDNIFTPEQEVNIYRIVQESLNNILKHAKAEASKVSVKKIRNIISISIKDNGVGFDFSERYQDIKSLGLKTLLERTKFLNGQMKIQSKRGDGTLIEFKFPAI